MHLSTIHIHLVNDLPFWQPGDWLEGVVTLKLRKSRSVKSVRLYLKSIEQTEWMDGKKKSNEAQWFDSVLILWGFPSGISYKEMSAGP